MDSGQEQNYWPGFVDALSNVVLTLIFVLVVFVFALSMASTKVEKRMKEVVKAEQEQKAKQSGAAPPPSTPEETQQLRQQLQMAQAEIEKLQAEHSVGAMEDKAEVVTDDQAPPKAQQGAVEMKEQAEHVLLTYPLSVADMDDNSATQLGHILDTVQQKVGKHKILLRSIVGEEPYSAAQRLAYYRAMTVRNFLITKGYGDSSSISSKIVQADHPDVGHVEIVFQHQ